METQPLWLLTLVSLLAIITLTLTIVSSTFTFCYLFLWQKMRAWFNKKAQAEFMPAKRIESPQITAAVIGAIIAVMAIISSMVGPVQTGAEITPLSVIMAIVQWGAIMWFCIYCKNIYKKRTEQMGKKAAKWSAIYLLSSCVTIIFISVILTGYVLAIYALFFIVDKVWGVSMGSGALGGSTGSSSASSNVSYRCCSSCSRFSHGKCNDNPSEIISDPAHNSCSSYTA